MHLLKCSEIWGGIESKNQDIQTPSLTASLYCKPYEGRKGGDIYYLSSCGKEILTRIAIGDVAGHGANVTEASRQLSDSLSSNLNNSAGKNVLSELNEMIWAGANKAITTAAVYTVNKAKSTLSFSIAGHPPFYMKEKNSNDWSKINIQNHTPGGNIPLGTLSNTFFDEESISVQSGDKFIFFTDGLLEVFNKEGKMFGKTQLLSVLRNNSDSSPDQLKQAVLNALKEHIGRGSFRDDLTFMTMEIK